MVLSEKPYLQAISLDLDDDVETGAYSGQVIAHR